jgi:hypothetical protein
MGQRLWWIPRLSWKSIRQKKVKVSPLVPALFLSVSLSSSLVSPSSLSSSLVSPRVLLLL